MEDFTTIEDSLEGLDTMKKYFTSLFLFQVQDNIQYLIAFV